MGRQACHCAGEAKGEQETPCFAVQRTPACYNKHDIIYKWTIIHTICYVIMLLSSFLERGDRIMKKCITLLALLALFVGIFCHAGLAEEIQLPEDIQSIYTRYIEGQDITYEEMDILMAALKQYYDFAAGNLDETGWPNSIVSKKGGTVLRAEPDKKAKSITKLPQNSLLNAAPEEDKLHAGWVQASHMGQSGYVLMSDISAYDPHTDLFPFKEKSILQTVINDKGISESELTYAKWASVKNLWFDSSKLKSLGDLYYCQELSQLSFVNGSSVTDLSPLSHLPKLASLYIDSDKLKNLQAISQMKCLNNLDLNINGVTDISPLGELKNLTRLYVSGKKIKDFSPLGGLSSLEELELRYSPVKDAGWLSGLTNMRRLILDRNGIKDFSFLAALVNLESLGISEENAIGGLSSLASLQKLNRLSFYADGPIDISALEGHSSLKFISFTFPPNRNGEIDIAVLKTIPSLNGLRLYRWKNPDLSLLQGMNGLRYLSIGESGIDSIEAVSTLTNLEMLDFSNGDQITDISPLVPLQKLWALDLNWNKVADISPLSDMPNLKRINLSMNPISDVTPLLALKNLEQVYFSQDQKIDTSLLDPLRENNPYIWIEALPRYAGASVGNYEELEAMPNSE